jgi:stearoyl-CoA desaturase (delta-9 desaturase)
MSDLGSGKPRHGSPDPREPVVRKQRKAQDDPHIHRMQRRHFIIFDLLPVFGTLVAIGLLPRLSPGSVEIGAGLVMWMLTGLGISVGYHRLFAHASFKAVPWVGALLAVFGAMAGQGGVISWVAIHRMHHEYSDRHGDVHSPNLNGRGLVRKMRGFVHAHLTWMAVHPYPNVGHYVPDLLRERSLTYVNRHYYRWNTVGLLVPAVLCGALTWSVWGVCTGFLWAGAVRIFVVEHLVWSINSVCHLIGRRAFRTRDESRNNWWLAPFIFGEAWHNNHHAFPNSASFGLAWHRVDPGYWVICLLAAVGLASEVRVPTRQQIATRLGAPTA